MHDQTLPKSISFRALQPPRGRLRKRWLVSAAILILGSGLIRTVGLPALAGERLLAFRAPAAPPPEGGTPTVESDFGSPAVDEPGSTQLPAEPDSRAAREQKIHQALDAVVILHHDTAPLEQVICGLARQLRIPVYIDRPTLVEEVVSLDQPVTIHVHGISARSALALLLEPLHLASLVEDEMLMVTTAAAASEKLETRVYDVTDLVAWRDPNRANRFDFSRVTQLLQTTIDPVSWQNLSGPGSIMEFDSDDYRVLCIRQTQPIHQKIRELLAAIRKPRRKDREDVIHPITVRHEETPAARREATIRRALDKTVTIAAANRPLETVLQELAAQMRVPLFLDRVTFADEGIAIDRPVAIQELKITAHSALKLVLESSQLVAIVHNETLFVTSAAKAGEFVEPQVYDVYDLVRRFRGNNGFLQWDTQSLINAIDCTIEPDSWDICGPSAFPFRSADTCVLVIPQTQPIHEKIAAFLEELKRTMSK